MTYWAPSNDSGILDPCYPQVLRRHRTRITPPEVSQVVEHGLLVEDVTLGVHDDGAVHKVSDPVGTPFQVQCQVPVNIACDEVVEVLRAKGQIREQRVKARDGTTPHRPPFFLIPPGWFYYTSHPGSRTPNPRVSPRSLSRYRFRWR